MANEQGRVQVMAPPVFRLFFNNDAVEFRTKKESDGFRSCTKGPETSLTNALDGPWTAKTDGPEGSTKPARGGQL
eukprot:scaffold373_cov350-Pavlova_lutheri.AAC.22